MRNFMKPPRNRTALFPRNLGILLLAIWLIIGNLFPLLHINFPSMGIVLPLIAAAAGLLLLLRQ